MLKKFLLVGLCGLISAQASYASSYPGDPGDAVKATPKITYDCNWQNATLVRYYVKKLRTYGIISVIYPYKLRVVVPDYVLFYPVSNTVHYAAKDAFYYLMGLLQQFPGAKIKVIGYSDDIGSNKANHQKTNTQAEKLSGYLWTVHIPNSTQTLDYQGSGAHHPIANNHYMSGMADNRRVEIIVNLPH